MTICYGFTERLCAMGTVFRPMTTRIASEAEILCAADTWGYSLQLRQCSIPQARHCLESIHRPNGPDELILGTGHFLESHGGRHRGACLFWEKVCLSMHYFASQARTALSLAAAVRPTHPPYPDTNLSSSPSKFPSPPPPLSSSATSPAFSAASTSTACHATTSQLRQMERPAA
jgi:hypothetical protein